MHIPAHPRIHLCLLPQTQTACKKNLRPRNLKTFAHVSLLPERACRDLNLRFSNPSGCLALSQLLPSVVQLALGIQVLGNLLRLPRTHR